MKRKITKTPKSQEIQNEIPLIKLQKTKVQTHHKNGKQLSYSLLGTGIVEHIENGELNFTLVV